MTRFVDLSHPLRVGAGSRTRLTTLLHSPRQRYRTAPDVSQLPLDTLANVPGRVLWVGVPPDRVLDVLAPPSAVRGRAVLFRTGWDRAWGTPAYEEDPPRLSRRTAAWLIDAEVALVGIDGPGLDDPSDPEAPVRTLLLGCEIPVVEHLRDLGRLTGHGFRFTAVPAAVTGAASLAVRAFAHTVELEWGQEEARQ